MRVGLGWVVAGCVIAGCASAATPAAVPGDAAADLSVDVPSLDALRDATAEARTDVVDASDVVDVVDVNAAPDMSSGCDPSLHVDCFFSVTCTGGVVSRRANAPYPCCTPEQCERAYRSNICEVSRYECPSGACAMARVGCFSSTDFIGFISPSVATLCQGGGHRVGDECTLDRDCVPMEEEGPDRLVCDRGTQRCVSGPRPETASGARCTWSDECPAGTRCRCDTPGYGGTCVGTDAGL